MTVMIVLLCVCVVGRVHGGPWTQHEGAYFVKLAFSRIDTKQEFDVHAQRMPLYSEFHGLKEGEYSSNDFTLYGEYGITEGFTIIGMTKFRQATASYVDSMLFQRPNSGLGDIYVAGRVALLNEPVAATIQAGWKIPAADTGSATTVALGNGNMDFDAILSLGLAGMVAGTHAYAESHVGYRFRGGNFGDEILYREVLGADLPGEHVSTHVILDGSTTQGSVNTQPGSPVAPGFAITSNQTYMRLTAGAGYHVSKKLQFIFDWTSVMNGRNTLAGNIITLGVVFTPGSANSLSPRR